MLYENATILLYSPLILHCAASTESWESLLGGRSHTPTAPHGQASERSASHRALTAGHAGCGHGAQCHLLLRCVPYHPHTT